MMLCIHIYYSSLIVKQPGKEVFCSPPAFAASEFTPVLSSFLPAVAFMRRNQFDGCANCPLKVLL